MRRKWLFLLALVASAFLTITPGWAKFGITKTRATILIPHPPAFPTPGKELRIQITSLDPRGGSRVAVLLQQLLEQHLAHENFEVVPTARTVLQCAVTEAIASVERHPRLESINVHVGERTEEDQKGKEKRVEDCKVQQAEVIYLVSSGSLSVNVTASDMKKQAVMFSQPVLRQYWGESSLQGPKQCGGHSYGIRGNQLQDPESILAWLTEQVAAATVPAVAGFDEPRPVLLAVDDELKAGNAHALAGNWQRALEVWMSAAIRKNETEAARQYNLGVAHEALAASALRAENLEEARAQLDQAMEGYDTALSLDPEEKYFRDTPDRLRQDREILQGFEQQQAWQKSETASRASAAAAGPAPTTESGPAEEWPEAESEAVHDFRAYVRKRLAIQKWEPSEAFQKKLVAADAQYNVKAGIARQVVDSEVGRFLRGRRNLQEYQELFEELAQDQTISAEERETLRTRQKTLHLSDDQVREVEGQFKEEGTAQTTGQRKP